MSSSCRSTTGCQATDSFADLDGDALSCYTKTDEVEKEPTRPHQAVRGNGFMEEEQNRAAKGQMIALMQTGHSWQEASTMAGVQISRSAAYRLLQKVRTQGEAGLQDGRHGHPAKLREPVQQWLKDYCHAAPSTPSHTVGGSIRSRGAEPKHRTTVARRSRRPLATSGCSRN